MVFLRFSGAGWLSPLIVLASLVLGGWLAGTIAGGPGPAPIVGWALVILVPIAALVVAAGRADRRRLRALADRRALAEARGWRLPVALPRLVVWGPAPQPGPDSFAEVADQFFAGPQGAAMRHAFAQMAQRPEVDADDPAFAAALATPDVRHATAAMDLTGWRIDGRDLILSRSYGEAALCPAAELVAVADRLTSLFYRFPLDAARRWATTPTTGVPLADAGR